MNLAAGLMILDAGVMILDAVVIILNAGAGELSCWADELNCRAEHGGHSTGFLCRILIVRYPFAEAAGVIGSPQPSPGSRCLCFGLIL